MVLVDTSVWVEHLRSGSAGLEPALQNGQVACHPFVIGELACGNLRNRSQILSLLSTLPLVRLAEHEEVMHVIEEYRLMGKGLGYIDVNLLASAMLSRVPLWTIDRRLNAVASTLGVRF